MCGIFAFENPFIFPPIVFRILSNCRNVLTSSSKNLQSLQGALLTPAMVGSTRSEKAKLEKEEREMAENTVWKVLIIIDMTAS